MRQGKVSKILPRYLEIAQDIERHILSGKWPPGHRIPPEQLLTGQYDCARMTVGKALACLVDAGLIERRRRVGTLVAKPGNQPAVIEVRDLKTEVMGRGAAYRYRLLGRRQLKASGALAKRMDVKPGTMLLELEAMHYADDVPFACERRLINLAEVPPAAFEAFEAVSGGAWLIEHVPWSSAANDISACEATGLVAKRLKLRKGAACLVMERQTWRNDRTITLARFTFPARLYHVTARFTPSRNLG